MSGPSLPDLVASRRALAQAALVAGRQRMSYGMWLESAAGLAGGLRTLGVARGDRLAVWLPNGHEAALCELAAAMAGVAVVGIPPGARPGELANVLRVARPKALVHAGDVWSEDAEAVFGPGRDEGRLCVLPAPGEQWRRLLASPRLDAGGGGDDPVRLFATSGTTQSPKFVVHHQGGVAWHARQAAQALGLGPSDVVACVLPLNGVFGHTTFWAAVAAGARIVLMSTFEARECAEAIAATGATCLFGSDVMLRRLLALPDAASSLSSLRWAGFAAFNGPARDLVAESEAVLGLPLFQVYGSTEAQALVAARSPGDDAERRAHAGGRLVDPDLEARVVDALSRAPVPVGTPGELELRGRSLFRGYLGNAQATRSAFDRSGSWYRTGDLARLEADRTMEFLGRLGDSLRLGGYLVDPSEIEEVLCAHAAVLEAQVVSGAEPGQRDLAVAFVRLARPTAEGDLRTWCESRIAHHKVPRRFVALDRLPVAHGPNGDKVQRAVLRQWAREGPGTTGRSDA